MAPFRAAEVINLVAFFTFVLLGWSRPNLGRSRRVAITAIGAGGLAITLFVSQVLPLLVTPLAASVTRDWIPYVLLLMFYWQAGQFVTRADTAFEAKLARLDRDIVAPFLDWCARSPAGPWILAYLEIAYLLCYVSLPMGLASLHLLRQGADVGHFWTVVLLAAYAAYGTLPFLQTRPPRVLGEKWSEPVLRGEPLIPRKIRAFNKAILRHASIHANTFPSGHVASTTACALVLLRLAPAWIGLIFLLVALSIAVGAVAGRYHYAADAILGFLVAIAASFVDRGAPG
ncbi:MAG TPA: phosphatase PAP2 family protein [Bryobacteraceae bacterium]|nr:phosphatase PAP2 family protein [Bryobacteraceae bacterium]